MNRSHKVRFVSLVALCLVALFGLWWLQRGPGGMDAISGNGNRESGRREPGLRVAVGPESTGGPEKPDEEEEEKKGKPAPEQELQSNREDRRRRRPRREEETKKEVAPEMSRWIVVGAFGLEMPGVKFQVLGRRNGVPFIWDLKSDAKGRLVFPVMENADEMSFVEISVEDENYSVEVLGQAQYEAFARGAVVRVLKKGSLTLWVIDEEDERSDLDYSALLFPAPKHETSWIPRYASPDSMGGETLVKCSPGAYELGIAPKGRPNCSVRSSMIKPAIVRIQPGRDTHAIIHESTWAETEWKLLGSDAPTSMQLEILGSSQSTPNVLGVEGNVKPNWRLPAFPTRGYTMDPRRSRNNMRFYEWFLRPVPTIAHVVYGGNGGALALLNFEDYASYSRGGSLRLGQGPGHRRSIELDALGGDGVRTTVRSLTKAPQPLQAFDQDLQVTTSRIEYPTPEWLEIKADYSNDSAWLHAEAIVAVAVSPDRLKLAKLMQPQVLDLRNPDAGREAPPSSPGLRWSYGSPHGAIRSLHVDLLANTSLQFPIPVPNRMGGHEGLLSWTPQSQPGVLGIGEWSVDPKRRRKNPTPGFRTIELRCVDDSGVPAPYAMVQAKSEGRTTWRGSADADGHLRLQILGPGPFWIDTGLVQYPVQLQVDDRNTSTQTLQLVVPTRESKVHLQVTGNLPLHILKARLSLWRPSREDPKRIFPAYAEENLSPDGRLVFQGLIPGEYKIELFDPRVHGVQQVLRVKITERDREPEVRASWRHKAGK